MLHVAGFPQGKHLNSNLKQKNSNINKTILNRNRVFLTSRQFSDLKLILNLAFSPLTGFMDEENYQSVLAKMRLKNGKLWPIPIILDVQNQSNYRSGSHIVLCDLFGKAIAGMQIKSIFKLDKQNEAKHVYGTVDKNHWGVNYLFRRTGNYGMGGEVYPLASIEPEAFDYLTLSPQELKNYFVANGWQKIIGFQTRNPIHQAHFALIKKAAQDLSAKVLIHPVVGETMDYDIDHITRIRSYLLFQKKYAANFTKLSLLPLAMRMAGPREAILHAIVRRNFGCSHFIIGRDHAGPNKSHDGKTYYQMYDAQILSKQHESEIGIKIVDYPEMVYTGKKKKYVPLSQLSLRASFQNVSGTNFRKMLKNGEEIPGWFSFPEVIKELKNGLGKSKSQGICIFMVGLPGSGKTTLARFLAKKLLEITDKYVEIFDGDVIRRTFNKKLGFSKKDRDKNIKFIGSLAANAVRTGKIAICAAIAPYREARDLNRRKITKYGDYIEIYLCTPVEICRTRDVNNNYLKSQLGIIKNFTGVDDPFELPINPDLKLDTTGLDSNVCTYRVLKYLRRKRPEMFANYNSGHG